MLCILVLTISLDVSLELHRFQINCSYFISLGRGGRGGARGGPRGGGKGKKMIVVTCLVSRMRGIILQKLILSATCVAL